MKKSLLLLTLMLLVQTGYSQKSKTYYINNDGEKISKNSAKYKRTVERQNTIWLVKDFYLNDSLRMTGSFLDKNLSLKTGVFETFYPNGKISNSVAYKDNLKQGDAQKNYIDGSVSEVQHYDQDKPSGTWIWYNEDGSVNNKLDNVNSDILDENYSRAKYVGGKEQLIKYLKSVDYKYPRGTRVLYNKTYTTFEIDEQGKVIDVDIIVHGTKQMDQAITEHLYNMPYWIPAKQSGQPVKVDMILPIRIASKGEKILSDKILADAFYSSAVDDFKEGSYDKTIFKLLNALQRNNEDARYYYLLANSYMGQNNERFACENWRITNSIDSSILNKKIKEFCKLN